MSSPVPPEGRGAALLKKLALRLDDGTVIRSSSDGGEGGGGGGGATVLTPADAYAAGALTEAHLLKAQALLCEVHARLPEEGPLRSIGSKRSADTAFEVSRVARCVAAAARRWAATLPPPRSLAPLRPPCCVPLPHCTVGIGCVGVEGLVAAAPAQNRCPALTISFPR